MKILVVDDETAIQRMVTRNLRDWGLDARGTGSGDEALALAEIAHRSGTPYSVFFIDVNLPDMQGPELIDRLHSLDPAAYIIVCTAADDPTVIDECAAAGARARLGKPFGLNDLRLVLAFARKRRPAGDDLIG